MGYMPYHEIASSVVLIRYDTSGNLVWAKEIGGIEDDLSYKMLPTSNGGYFITGVTQNGVGIQDILNVKLDANG